MFSKLNDRIWMRLHKRPPSPRDAYANVIMPWIAIGMLGIVVVIVGAGATSSVANARLPVPASIMWFLAIAVLITLLCFAYLVASTMKRQKRDGHYDAIARQGLVDWETRKKRIEDAQNAGK